MEPKSQDIDLLDKIHALIESLGYDCTTFEADLISQQIFTSLKLLHDKHELGQLKLITRALKEMRYAYRIFNQYTQEKRVSIFGSARTPESHPDYIIAKEFSKKMADLGWMCITGAAMGIMKAGLEGAKPEARFGLSIRLPFESSVAPYIEGDPKLIIFRYFFTRKLMFISHSHAIAVFPGGFGTLDELFEVLTLMQTGKATIVPVLLMESGQGNYWENFEHYIQEHLEANGWISPEDHYFYYMTTSVEKGVEHIQHFYRRYHSSRYVKDLLVIRMTSPLTDSQVKQLNQEFASLVAEGSMWTSDEALPEEDEALNLPRLVFHHTRNHFGLVRKLINQINDF